MCNSVEEALKEHFGYSLSSPEVVILDPCTGTGDFIVNLIERIPGKALSEAYHNRLFANEVMLLPYYVASLNIEHAYYERMRSYESFEGLCFVDTLDMQEAQQFGLFTPANTDRVEREKKAAVTVIIGNPPYNVCQKSENDNNPNRKYKVVDGRIRDTYSRSSRATSTSKLDDAYVKFFRWATDRLGDRDGIVCFVSNNGFIDQHAFDGMRKNLTQDFEQIAHLDLHGNVRRNPKLSGTTHNVFGIQVGVGITLAIKKRGAKRTIRYFRVPETWRKHEKLNFLSANSIPWNILTPDTHSSWILPQHADEYTTFISIRDLFAMWSLGIGTNRDQVVFSWDREELAVRMRHFIADYNAEVHRHKSNRDADWPDHIKWSETLKAALSRGSILSFNHARIVGSLYRPFTKKFLYFERLVNERVYQWPKISGRVIAVPGIGNRKKFGAFISDTILPRDFAFEKIQCFPLSHLNDSALTQFRQPTPTTPLRRKTSSTTSTPSCTILSIVSATPKILSANFHAFL